ncbi:1220_t:CDS:2 [Ambispora leptoticha]|uniref:1220_t:CDS:1 n=1 Tax=Ambispora leptoticha TaxID=144679 RepID=A0A9N9ARU9_9GLOM|nr:1220_t:CDS:2 [Ambispora leptoticha]
MSTPLDSKTVKKLLDQNQRSWHGQNKSLDKTSQSHKKKGTENIAQVIADGIQDNKYSFRTRLYQYAIEHEINPKEFSVITEAEKNRKKRKYREFLTDRERLVGEELSRRSIIKSGLSTAWLDDLMEEWEKVHTQFIQTFSPDEVTTKA